VLGIDPGTATTGWAILCEKDGKIEPLAYGHISTSPEKSDEERIFEIIANTGFKFDLLLKDYYVTVLLYLLKDETGIYFKGGTALQKILLKYSQTFSRFALLLLFFIREKTLLVKSSYFT